MSDLEVSMDLDCEDLQHLFGKEEQEEEKAASLEPVDELQSLVCGEELYTDS